MTSVRLRLLDLLQRPWVPGVVMLTVATVFVLVRLIVVAHGDPGVFVVAGARFQDPATGPTLVPVLSGPRSTGFDGQFAYRFALAPWDLSVHAHGIRLDHGLRRSRIGYPVLAWLLAGGQAVAIPWTLVVVNVLAVGATGWGAGVLAQQSGRPALAGLLVAGFSSTATSLARDLTDPVAVALMVWALVALRRERWAWAGAALAFAVITRETALLLPAGLLVARLVRRQPRGRSDLAWLLPVLVFVAWQSLNRVRYGAFPIADGGSTNSGIPFAGIGAGYGRWLSDPSTSNVTVMLLYTSVFLVMGLGLTVRGARPGEKAALVLGVLLATTFVQDVYDDTLTQNRVLVEEHVLAATLLLGSARSLLLPAVVTAAPWLLLVIIWWGGP